VNDIDPRLAYRRHKAAAQQRGIEFDLTFYEWWAIWQHRYENRGRCAGQLNMCRFRDEGGYTPGNVRIDSHRANMAEAGVVKRVARSSTAYRAPTKMVTHTPAADWLIRKNVFVPYVEPDEDG
jgi:hypothetical protein